MSSSTYYATRRIFNSALVLFRVDATVKKRKRKKSGGWPVKIHSHHDIGIIVPPAGLPQRDAIGFFIALSIGIVNRHVPSQGQRSATTTTITKYITGADETLASLIWPADSPRPACYAMLCRSRRGPQNRVYSRHALGPTTVLLPWGVSLAGSFYGTSTREVENLRMHQLYYCYC